MKAGRKISILLVLVLSISASQADAFNVKGYEWGRPLEDVRKDLERSKKDPVFDEGAGTVVFTDKVFGKECRVSLLFTPKTRLLAGIAMVWLDPAVVNEAIDHLTKKYGPPAPSSGRNKTRRYFIWYSPVSRYDRIALIGDLNRTVLGYYGGEYYKKYEEESVAKKD